jgi:hypothetical protein
MSLLRGGEIIYLRGRIKRGGVRRHAKLILTGIIHGNIYKYIYSNVTFNIDGGGGATKKPLDCVRRLADIYWHHNFTCANQAR